MSHSKSTDNKISIRAAIAHCRQVTEFQRVISLLDCGSLTEAIGCLEQLSNEYPDSYSIHFSLAEAYYLSQQLSAAHRIVARLFDQGVERPQLYLLSAAIQLSSRRLGAAQANLDCARRASITLPGWHAVHGELLRRERDFAGAEAAFAAAIATDGPSCQSLDGLAVVDLHFGRYEQAAIHALDALAIEMRFGRAHFHLALALMHLNKSHESLQALETWAALMPQSAAPHWWMARVCDEAFHDPQRAAAYRSVARHIVQIRRSALKSSTKADTSAPSSAP